MQRLQRLTRIAFVFAGLVAVVTAAEDANPWESAIAQFEQADQKTPPPKEAVLFVGSSTIVGWDLKKSFPELTTINRGFGGSQIADSVRYADRIVIPHQPRAIVFYAGGNDLAGGKSPETVERDFKAFVDKVHAALPDVPILYIAIKPTIARWHLVEKVRDANRRIEVTCQAGKNLKFIPVEKSILGADGKPQADLFQTDRLHLNAAGYEILTRLVREALPKP
jgi:lysophospholipase L1-like esterase